ncbi:MAG: hypothetical protein FWE23_00780 [Chitinivibrionia bacterium]|nr:hypothetical protein [Chitinivibrionia bacterium]
MKILFINIDRKVDYQSDVVFHGLKTLYGRDVYEISNNWFMFNDMSEEQKQKLKRMHGKGFSTTGLLDSKLRNVITTREVRKKVKQRFFDLVVYGAIWRCQKHFDLISIFYPKERIISIDGKDQTYIHSFFANKTLHFKRELIDNHKGIFPISFAIPKEKIINEIKPKEKMLAHIIPGDVSTYIYENESDYYHDYAISYFGKTTKKSGWDCFRHYEIMANGCIPWFPDLSDCPKEIMTSFPKELILKTNNVFDEISNKAGVCNHELLNEYCEQIRNFTKEHLTTDKIAEYLINTALSQKIIKTDNKSPFFLALIVAELWNKIKRMINDMKNRR